MAYHLSGPREFHPALLSRRGEITAWALALVTLIGLLILRRPLSGLPWSALIFAGFLVMAAGSITLGNWMDRRTFIRMNLSGITFYNGLRHAAMAWGEIKEVRVIPGRFGDKVHVIGDSSHFSFRMLAEVKYQGEVRGQFGFPAGEEILQIILNYTDLQVVQREESGRYFARR